MASTSVTRIFPRLASVACFPALGIVARFSTLGMSHMFPSRFLIGSLRYSFCDWLHEITLVWPG